MGYPVEHEQDDRLLVSEPVVSLRRRDEDRLVDSRDPVFRRPSADDLVQRPLVAREIGLPATRHGSVSARSVMAPFEAPETVC